MNKALDTEKAKARPYVEQMQKSGKSDAEANSDQKYLGYLLELRDNILALLSPPQIKRLRELSLQSVDIGGVLDVVVAKKLGMSVAQLTK